MRLTWDQVGERFYEVGVSNGVLYQDDGFGVPWNGLTSVEESTSTEVEAVYFDGVKIDDIVSVGDFEATLKAYTFPDEFLQYEGVLQDQTGFYVTGQKPSRFGLAYKTVVGNDLDGTDAGYKLHIVYNITAIPANTEYAVISDELDPIEFEWKLTAIPEEIEKFRPSAHIIFDSRKIDPYLLADIEDILYGSDSNDAYLPSLKGLSAFIRKWQRLIVIDNGDGTWTAISPTDVDIVMTDSTTFEITSPSAVFIDADSYTLSSADKNEEDVWLP